MSITSAILICLVVTFFVYQNIQKVSNDGEEFEGIEQKDKESTATSFDKFSKFALFIQTELEKLQDKVKENSSFFTLKGDISKEKFDEQSETLLSKISVLNSSYLSNKPKNELEDRMFSILNAYDVLIESSFTNGEKLADHYRDLFSKEHKRVGL